MSNYLKAKGWLTKSEREFLKNQASMLSPDADIINVGIEYGASLHCLRAGNSSATIHAFDLIGDEKLEGLPRALIYKGDSANFASRWVIDSHFIFIDGDHSYNGVVKDTKFILTLVPGGCVAFHDCYSWESPGMPHKICPEVNQAVDAWYEMNKGDFQEIPCIDSIRAFIKNG